VTLAVPATPIEGEGPGVPAPWELTASGYVLVLRLPRSSLDTESFTRLGGARLVSARIDSRFFPPFDASYVMAAVRVSDVCVPFPKAVIDVPKDRAHVVV
jgi:hypothetical protein